MAILYGVSFALHATLGVGVAEIEPAREPERIAITMLTPPKPKPKLKDEPPPPPPPVEAPKAKAVAPKAKAAEPVTEAPAPVADAPSFGIAMTGGVGLGGVAVPVGDLRGAAEPTKRVAQAKTLVEPKRPKPEGEAACAEPATKPRPLQMERPEYTEEARAAAIEGRVRVELTVDAAGLVREVKVLEGLGHGLDEAAVRAAQAASFEPAMQCGQAVGATFVVSIRFSL